MRVVGYKVVNLSINHHINLAYQSQSEIEKKIQDLLDKGYQPYGMPFEARDVAYQAFVLHN